MIMKNVNKVEIRSDYVKKFFIYCVLFLFFTTLTLLAQANAQSLKGTSAANVRVNLSSDVSFCERVEMFRLYNSYTGEHFYTSSTKEKNELIKAGWKDENTAWISPITSKTPVYRLYNPYVSGGDHYYTTNEEEYEKLKENGWKQEGIGWYSVDIGDTDRISVYQQYNPYAITGTHNYTSSETEKNNLIKAGWKFEGEAWYAYSKMAYDISKATVTLGSKLTYNGQRQTQTVEHVKLGSITLVEGTDYTIKGNTETEAGEHTLTIVAKGSNVGSIKKTYSINKKEIMLTAVKVFNKTYDQSTEATIDEDGTKLEGVCENDDVYLKNITASFNDKYAEDNKEVSLKDFVIDGKSVDNYELASSGNIEKTTASITACPFTLEGIGVDDKTYDGRENADLDLSKVRLNGVLTGDDVQIDTLKGKFADANYGIDKTVTLYDLKLKGTDARNYKYEEESTCELTASINKKALTIMKLSLQERSYKKDDVYARVDVKTAEFKEGDVLNNDDVSVAAQTYSYSNDKAGDDKSVTLLSAPTISGKQASNYYVKSWPKTVKGNVLAIVKFNTNCLQSIEDVSVHLGQAVELPKTIYREGLKIENWYTDAKCSDNSVWALKSSDKADSGTRVESNITELYANWVPDEGPEGDSNKFWIAQSSICVPEGSNEAVTNSDYKSEKWNIKKSYEEILNDIQSIKKEAESGEEGMVTQEYQEMMKSDKYHLYTKYKGNTNTYGTGGPSDEGVQSEDCEKNGYLEARIIQVGSHDEDGTSLTFQTVHVLPQAISMNSTNTNEGGWASSNPLNVMTSSNSSVTFKYIYKNNDAWKYDGETTYSALNESSNVFSYDFYDNIISLQKKYNVSSKTGSGQYSETKKSKMWLLSYNEIIADQDTVNWTPSSGTEGSTYDWYKLHQDTENKTYKFLGYKTRNGQVPRCNYDSNLTGMWLRSSSSTSTTAFIYFDKDGSKDLTDARRAMGIALAFAM